MSSTICRCYDGVACPASSSGGDNFFADMQPDELSHAVVQAVSDYVHLRGLNGLCPDLKRWGSPPGPAAFLDCGLPKTGGSGSLPRGLSLDGVGCLQQLSSFQSGGRDSTRRRTNSIPSPTWEAVGHEGSICQVLSFSDENKEFDAAEEDVVNPAEVEEVGVVGGASDVYVAGDGHESRVGDAQNSEIGVACSVPHGGKRLASVVETMPAELFSIDAKQLLRSLREQGKTADHRRHCRSARPSRCPGDPGRTPGSNGIVRRQFSPPDAWDDTGLFTVAPRPKSLPSWSHRQRRQKHALAARVSRVCLSSTSAPTLPDVQAATDRGQSTSSLGEQSNEEDMIFPAGRGVKGFAGAVGVWPRTRRESGGGGGDTGVEFLDVREAALVSVAEALARRALPWQAQLCPRALQDLEIARTRVFHQLEQRRLVACERRAEVALRTLLLGEERSLGVFARNQDSIFEDAFEKIDGFARTSENSYCVDLSTRKAESDARVKRAEGRNRYDIHRFEDTEAVRAWLHRRSIQADLMWDPSSVMHAKQAEEERAVAALEQWRRGESWATVREHAFAWLEAAGASALTAAERFRWERGIRELASEDEGRAVEDRARERQRSTERYVSVLQSVLEADRRERSLASEAWNLHGWLSVGTHKLVQQTLRALVRRCTNQYAMRNILWEAREAAEFAASARTAAAAQRANDCREMCATLRAHKSTARKHKRDMIQAAERRASGEDVERNRAADQLVEELGEATLAKSLEAKEQFQRERVRASLARKQETERSLAYREEALTLTRELDNEAERVASSLSERRAEEEEHISTEVAGAAAALKEEQARSDDRDVLLHEMMLRERDNQDRLLKEWLLREEYEDDGDIRRSVEQLRASLAEDTTRWTENVSEAMSKVTLLDVSYIQERHTWILNTTATPASSPESPTHSYSASRVSNIDAIWASVQAQEDAIIHERESQIELWKCGGIQRVREATEAEGFAAEARFTRLEALARLTYAGIAAHWFEFWQSEADRARLAAVAGDMVAFRWSQRQHAAAGRFWATWRNREWKSGTTSQDEAREAGASTTEDATAVGFKATATESDDRVVEDGVQGAETAQGHVQDGVEAEKISGAEIEPAAVTGSQAQTNVAAVGLDRDGSVMPRDDPVHGNALPVVTAEIPLEEDGVEGKAETGMALNARQAHNQDGTTNAAFTIDGDICASEANVKHRKEAEDNNIADKDANDVCIDGEIESPETAPDGINQALSVTTRGIQNIGSIVPEPTPEPAMNELVVFVGIGTASHLATLQLPSPTEFVDLRRSSYVTLQTPGGEEPTKVSHNSACQNDEEAGWLRALDNSVGANETVELSALGATVGRVPGGVAVLCLACDSIITEETELNGLVRAEVLTSATEALVKARRRMRVAMASTPEVGSTVGDNVNRGLEGAAGDAALPGLGAAVAAVATMEATVEMEIVGDELCADLSTIFERQSDVKYRYQSIRVNRALQKHAELLSPASISALTALLSARGQLTLPENDRSGLGAGVSDGFVTSPGGDAGAWRSVVMDALVAVRTASLEHAVMWAASCDLDAVESACKYDVGSVEVGAGGVVEQQKEGGDDSHAVDKAIWTRLQRVSGLGLSALVLLAATLPDEVDMSRNTTLHTSSDNSQKRDRAGCGDVADLRLTVLSLMKLLSPSSLANVARCLSHGSSGDETNGVDNVSGKSALPIPQHTEVLSFVPGHTALGDLSGLDANILAQGAHGVLAALDADSTGALPTPEVLLALQSGKAGFRLERAQASAILRLAGILEGKPILNTGGQNATNPLAAPNEAPPRDRGDYCHLGYPPGTLWVEYGPLARKIAGLVRLIRAAHRLRRAAGETACRTGSMDGAALECAREGRRRMEAERGPVAFASALGVVRQRMAYRRHERRASMLEVPRLQTMRHLAALAQERAHSATKTRKLERRRQSELRGAFSAAIQERIAAVSAGVYTRSREMVTAELWAMAKGVLLEAWDRLTVVVAELGVTMIEVEEALQKQDLERIAEDHKARELYDQEPEWWGEGLTQEVEASYRQEALWAQKSAEELAMGEVGLAREITAAWEADAKICKEAFPEIERKLDVTMAEFEKRRAASTEAINAALTRDVTASSQPDSAETMQTRHYCVAFCRENLVWLGEASDYFDAECAALREHSAALPLRAEKRLATVLDGAAAKSVQERSVIARRLQSVSSTWGQEIARRKSRWEELHRSRRNDYGKARGLIEVTEERAGPIGPLATAARAKFLANAVKSIGTAVTTFSENARNGPSAAEAKKITEAASITVAKSFEAVTAALSSGGARRGSDVQMGGDDGCAGRLLAMAEESAATRARACGDAVEKWWSRQITAAEEGLRLREREVQERRIRRQVTLLMKKSLVTEIEAWHAHETLANKTLGRVLAESKRIAVQCAAAERAAGERASAAAAEARLAAERETDVLSLEAKALSGRVLTVLRRGLDTAADDLAIGSQKTPIDGYSSDITRQSSEKERKERASNTVGSEDQNSPSSGLDRPINSGFSSTGTGIKNTMEGGMVGDEGMLKPLVNSLGEASEGG